LEKGPRIRGSEVCLLKLASNAGCVKRIPLAVSICKIQVCIRCILVKWALYAALQSACF
jgi:hypothetical protein